MKQDKIMDSATGIELTPSYHGEKCLGSGDMAGYECCCDECDYYLYCFPEFDWEAPCAGAKIPSL